AGLLALLRRIVAFLAFFSLVVFGLLAVFLLGVAFSLLSLAILLLILILLVLLILILLVFLLFVLLLLFLLFFQRFELGIFGKFTQPVVDLFEGVILLGFHVGSSRPVEEVP